MYVCIHVYIESVYTCVYICIYMFAFLLSIKGKTGTEAKMPTFLDGYCSTVQGLLDWFEVQLGFTELLFI